MEDEIIKAMIQNTLTEDQFLKVKEIYDQRIYKEERARKGHDFTPSLDRGITAEDILQTIKGIEKQLGDKIAFLKLLATGGEELLKKKL